MPAVAIRQVERAFAFCDLDMGAMGMGVACKLLARGHQRLEREPGCACELSDVCDSHADSRVRYCRSGFCLLLRALSIDWPAAGHLTAAEHKPERTQVALRAISWLLSDLAAKPA